MHHNSPTEKPILAAQLHYRQLYYRQAIMAFKCMTGHAPKYRTSQFITREQVANVKLEWPKAKHSSF